jgi:hypothetical protein
MYYSRNLEGQKKGIVWLFISWFWSWVLKKTGSRRRIVNKEDLVAEDKPRLVSSYLGPVVGNGKEEGPF